MQLAKFDDNLQNMTIVTSYDEATPFDTQLTATMVADQYLHMSPVKHDGKFYCCIPSEPKTWQTFPESRPDDSKVKAVVLDNGKMSLGSYCHGKWETLASGNVTHWIEQP